MSSLMANGFANDRDDLKKSLEERLKSSTEGGASLKLESIQTTPIPGIYEVVTEDHKILYSDSLGRYLITGHLIDTQNLKDLTADRLDEVTAVAFDKLPVEQAIKEVRGDGRRKVAVFSDTDCPFCRRLEKDIEKATNVTIYTFLFPIAALHPNAYDHSRRIWCADNQLQAWKAYWNQSKLPEATSKCDASALQKNQELGRRLGIDATPTLIFESGRLVPGAISGDQFEKLLDQH